MQATEAIQSAYAMSQMVLKSYIGDLSDEDLRRRPHPKCNSIAWQLGHLILSEQRLLQSIGVNAPLDLPDGFAETHDKENAASDDSTGFLTRDAYLAMFERLQSQAIEALAKTSAEQLDEPGPEFLKGFADTVGAVYVLVATHAMMHVGQFVPVRRELGKPIVI